MSSTANVTIHSSQFPENVRRSLLESLRTRQLNHKFLYDSARQTRKWLALHQGHSPARNDADCAATYDRAFTDASTRLKSGRVHLIGLGCGGGQKDSRLLELLKLSGQEVSYSPCDVGTDMVLVARQTALSVVPEANCFPLVCDLAVADDLPAAFERHAPPATARLVTFFGMIPNFEPQLILPKLAALVRPEDFLLFSANLAPGPDYAAGVRRVLPQYDNPLTRDWLLSFLHELGIGGEAGELRFQMETDPSGNGLQRIAADFHFTRSSVIQVEAEKFEFRARDRFRLFYSYRYTPALIRNTLNQYGLKVLDEWITRSEEEGVFLCRRS